VANAKVTIKGTVLDGNAARATSSASATMWALGAAVSLQTPVASSIQGSKVTKSRAVVTTGGTATASGAGFYLVGRPLVVRRSLVASNFADATGGSGSTTAEGGGLSLKSGANVQLVGSTVRGNRADSGGGVSTSTGGGIDSASSILRVRTSTLNANVAATSGQALGGGIHLASGGPHTVENSTLSGNRANGTTARGGAIDVDTTLGVTAATIARNSAKLGGGIYVEGGTTTLRATLLGLNTATMSGANCSQSVASAGRNLVASTLGCTFAATGTDKTGLAPKIGLLGAHGGPTQTIPLLAGSPALNRIPKAECPFGLDQRGVRRPQPKTGRCDIGAYERKP
jgi:hypothetical protein